MLKALVLSVLVGCSPVDPGRVVTDVATAELAFDEELTPLQWVTTGANHYEVLADDSDVTRIATGGFQGVDEHLGLEAPVGVVDELTNAVLFVRASWVQGFGFPPPGSLLCELRHSDSTVVASQTVTFATSGVTEEFLIDFGVLSLTAAQAADLSVFFQAQRTGPQQGHNIYKSFLTVTFTEVATSVPEICIGGEFQTDQEVEAGFDMETSMVGVFSTTVVIMGSVELETLTGQSETVPPALTVLPSVDPDAINEICMSGEFQSVVELTASFVAEQSFIVSVQGC